MSIAVSAVVRPSRFLFVMLGAMSTLVAVIGGAVATGMVGNLTVALRFAFGICTIFFAFLGFYHGACHRKPIHIDISGTGALRLAEATLKRPCAHTKWPHVEDNNEEVCLLKSSTIWPCLLLLRLQSDSGKITVLPILPDSVSQNGFRALTVACRWVAAHTNQIESKSAISRGIN